MYTSRPLTFGSDLPGPVVIFKPDTEEYPGSSKLYEHRDLKGQSRWSVFYPEEDETRPGPWARHPL